jgi:hypothetical protein
MFDGNTMCEVGRRSVTLADEAAPRRRQGFRQAELAAVVAAFAAATAACSREVEVGIELIDVDPDSGATSLLTVAHCEPSTMMARACVIDSEGKSYGISDDGDIIVAVEPPYAAYFVYDANVTPDPSDVSATGTGASVRVYGAPWNRNGTPCCPEDDEANRIAAHASTTREGGVLVVVPQRMPPATQISIQLDTPALFRSRSGLGGSSPPQAVPNADKANPQEGSCQLPLELCSGSFSAGFYLGSVPAYQPNKR